MSDGDDVKHAAESGPNSAKTAMRTAQQQNAYATIYLGLFDMGEHARDIHTHTRRKMSKNTATSMCARANGNGADGLSWMMFPKAESDDG